MAVEQGHGRRLAVLVVLGVLAVAVGLLLATRGSQTVDLRQTAMRCLQAGGAAAGSDAPSLDLGSIAAGLADSREPDAQVFRAWLTETDREQAQQALATALALAPDHALALQTATDHCGGDNPAGFCSEVLAGLTEHPDPTTGTWMTAAVLAARLGDSEAARDHLAHAAQARPDSHVADRVSLAARVLQQAGPEPVNEAALVEAAFGTAMAAPAPASAALALCSPGHENYLGTAVDADCVALGTRLARSGRSLADRVTGLTIWEKQARAAGDGGALEEIEQLNAARADLQLRMIGLTCADGENRLASLAYVDSLARFGEIGAAQRMVEQVEAAD